MVLVPSTESGFECKCKNGCYGDTCQAFKPTTCQDYWTVPKPSSGIYKVYDSNGNASQVVRDFDSEKGIAWTLVTSCGRDQTPVSYLQTFLQPISISWAANGQIIISQRQPCPSWPNVYTLACNMLI